MNTRAPLDLTSTVEALGDLFARASADDIAEAIRRLPRAHLHALGRSLCSNPIVTQPGPAPDYVQRGCMHVTGCPRRADAVRFLTHEGVLTHGGSCLNFSDAMNTCSDIEHGKPVYIGWGVSDKIHVHLPVTALRQLAKRWRDAGFTVEIVLEDLPETHSYSVLDELGFGPAEG